MTRQELRRLRRAKEITQEKLAELSGISLATINRAEKSGKVRLCTMQKLFQLNILPQYHTAFFGLVEQRCMDAFTFKMDSEYDHEYYSDYVL